MRAYRPFFQAYLSRGARCWFATRALVTTVLWLAGLGALRLSPVATIEVVVVSLGVGLLDTSLRRESALLGNLAIHPIALGSVLGTPAMLGELAVSLAVGALS
jgi:hypothetical protein